MQPPHTPSPCGPVPGASSEIGELIGLCERIYVMREGHIRAELEAEEGMPERLLAAAL